MSGIDRLIALLAPHECLNCSVEGEILCAKCIEVLKPCGERCYYCLKPSPKGATCDTCATQSPLASVMAATPYGSYAKDMLWMLKSSGAQSVAKTMAKVMAPFVSTDCLLIPVPTATSRVRQRGYDQAELLAKHLSRLTGVRMAKPLSRFGQTHQVGAARDQRKSQLGSAFYISKPYLIHKQAVLLIDDVMTTGATLEAAAHVLLRAGAAQVDALTFARA
jgi:ComF family protein